MRTKLKYLGVLVLGVVIGYLSTQWKYFEIDTTVNAVRLGGIIVNATILIFIASYINGKSAGDRYEKELIIDEIDKLINLLETLSSDFTDKDSRKCAEFYSVVSLFKKVKQQISKLDKYIEAASYGFDVGTEEVLSKIKKWNSDLTDRPPEDDKLIVTGYELGVFKRDVEAMVFNLHQDKFRVNNK